MSSIVIATYRLVFLLKRAKIPLLPQIINKMFVRLLFGCDIGIGAEIGKRVCLAYGGLGTVISSKSVIGNDVYIGTGVTVGGTNRNPIFPVIGDNCLISTGVKVIGPVSVGSGCVIGANAVVVTDIPDNCLAVGVPAKVLKTDIDVSEYR